MLMEGVIGPIFLEIKEEELVEKGLILQPEYYCLPVEDPKLIYPGAKEDKATKSWVYDTHNGKPEYADVYDGALVNNRTRNNLIVQVPQAYLEKYDAPALVLVERRDHGAILVDLCREFGIDFGRNPTSGDREDTIHLIEEQLPVCACLQFHVNHAQYSQT